MEECKDYRWSPTEQNQRSLVSHTLRWRGRGGKWLTGGVRKGTGNGDGEATEGAQRQKLDIKEQFRAPFIIYQRVGGRMPVSTFIKERKKAQML